MSRLSLERRFAGGIGRVSIMGLRILALLSLNRLSPIAVSYASVRVGVGGGRTGASRSFVLAARASPTAPLPIWLRLFSRVTGWG